MEEKLNQLDMPKAFVVALVVAALYYFVMYDDGSTQERSIERTRTQITEQQNELQRVNRAVREVERFTSEIDQVKKEMAPVFKSLPKDATTSDLMRVLSDEAKKVGLTISNISPGGAARQTPGRGRDAEPVYYEPISVSVQFSGKYNQIMTFLSAMTKKNKVILVTDLTLSRAQSGRGDNAQIDPVISLRANFQSFNHVNFNLETEDGA